MTPTQQRNAHICAAMYALTHQLPEQKGARGIPAYRKLALDGLTIMSSVIDGETALDAFLTGSGKVASFRISADKNDFRVVSLKVKTLPQWVSILDAAINQAANRTNVVSLSDHARQHLH